MPSRQDKYLEAAEDLTRCDAYITSKERAGIDKSDFAWPEERKYPINSPAHYEAAKKLVGRAPSSKQAAIKARIEEIAKRKGYTK